MSILFGAVAHAGSPLTLAILKDDSMRVAQLDVAYVRSVKCEKPDLPPNVKIVTEQGVLKLCAKKSFYISELSLKEPSKHVCFMPEHTVTMTTGGDIEAEQTGPAQTWNQTSQKLDIGRITVVVGTSRVEVDAACSGKAKLDTGTGLQVLKLRQVGSLASKSKTGRPSKPGAADATVRIECEVTPQP